MLGFVKQFLSDRLAIMKLAADAVLQMVSQVPYEFPALHVAFLLLRFCVAPKADHLLRHLPPLHGAALGADIDQLLLETLQSLFGFRLDPEKSQLPIETMVSLGVLFSMTMVRTSMKVTVKPKPTRCPSMIDELQAILRSKI